MRISARLLLFLFFVVTPAFAKTYTAASCKQSDVNAALNASKKDDKSTVPVVIVPEGNCPTTSVALPRTIVFQGAGKDKTILGPLNGGDTGSRVTGFTFTTASNTTTALITFEGQNWRVDHVKCINTSGVTFSNCVWAYGARAGKHPTGLVDHVDATNARILVYGDGLDKWSEPSTIGKAVQTGVVTVEDSTFEFTVHGNVIDGQLTARYVFRHNRVKGTPIEIHSNQGARNGRSFEIYNNVIDMSGSWIGMFLRGGTGVVFNNVINGLGTGAHLIGIDNVKLGPYPMLDQIGRGRDLPRSAQELEPAYFWNNTRGDGTPVNPVVVNGADALIQVNRDYFLSPRPGYTPSPYPHPLQNSK